MVAHPKPSLVLSKCLELEACRYNGVSIRSDVVRALLPHVDVRPVCPEVDIGLGTPRDPIRLVGTKERRRLVQPSTGRDLTTEMRAFAKGYLDGAGDVDGFILKSRSPSCGVTDAKIHQSASDPETSGTSAGMFGAAVIERYPYAAVESEGRLDDFRRRHHFLTKLFLRARFRLTAGRRTVAALVGFHAANTLLLMAYQPPGMSQLGRIAANESKDTADRVLGRYGARLGEILARPPRSRATVNVFTHILGYVSDGLTATETARFLDAVTAYREKRVTMNVPLDVIHPWLARIGHDYLAHQTLFEPYPSELLMIG